MCSSDLEITGITEAAGLVDPLAWNLQRSGIVSIRFAFVSATRTLGPVRSVVIPRFPLIPGNRSVARRPEATAETFATLDRFLPPRVPSGTSGGWVRFPVRTEGAGGNGHRAQACVRETHGGAGRPPGWRILRPMAITAGSSSVSRASSGQHSDPLPGEASHVFQAQGGPPADLPPARRPASCGMPQRAREQIGRAHV